ncbi:MAG TPA: T9SS type A sorting domain-containing protein, partial [Bacteroidales bacterium]|nr:T9SS type A sorting domain-containing protein [Bacteroidales bacterium]
GNTGQWSAQVNVYDTTCEPQFYNNDIQYGKDSLGNFIAQGIYEDNIDTIPDFVGGLPFNYQLNATSACIDAGHDTIIDPDLTRSDIGAYYFDQTGIGTGDFIAEESRLHLDNYPNPFTDNTVIRFSLPELSVTTCRLSIFDIRGTEIDVITNERLSGGKYQSEYDASDLPNGIYIMRLQVGEKMVSSKMVKM